MFLSQSRWRTDRLGQTKGLFLLILLIFYVVLHFGEVFFPSLLHVFSYQYSIPGASNNDSHRKGRICRITGYNYAL